MGAKVKKVQMVGESRPPKIGGTPDQEPEWGIDQDRARTKKTKKFLGPENSWSPRTKTRTKNQENFLDKKNLKK